DVCSSDLLRSARGVEPANIVVLHRVVCCHPDYEQLLADHSRRLVVLSYPPRHAVSRAFVSMSNALLHLLRRRFRSRAWSAQVGPMMPSLVTVLVGDTGIEPVTSTVSR